MNKKNTSPDKLINERIISEQTQTLSSFFRKKSETLQENIGEGFKTLYPQKEIAKKLNISVDQLRQKLYGKKPLTRDWLIAICAAYGLDDYDTSEALSICNMPTLDDVSKREEFIVHFLRTHKNKSVSVDEFNRALEASKLPILDISYRNGKTSKNDTPLDTPYTEYRPKTVRTYEDEGDPYNSLATIYYPNNRCVAAAFLEDKHHKKYLLEAFSDGKYSIQQEKTWPSFFDTLDPADQFYMYFTELAILVQKEKQRIDDIYNDSRNYRYRLSANLKNDKIHIFYEEFNYSMPERNEYLLMEYVDGHYALSVANKSMFMQEYMTSEQYYEHYHTYDPIRRITYTSLEEIDKRFEKIGRSFYPGLARLRKSAFKRLQKKVSDELDAIRTKKVFIQDASSIWDNPYDVLRYYGIEKEFECTYEPEYGEIVSAKDSATFFVDSNDQIQITIDDITRAFELGFSNIVDICQIKYKTGSIESVLS